MKIHGFQKTTLLDFPGLVACTVFTAGCNLRCPFCHNAFLVTQIDKNSEISTSEIIEYLNRRKGILDGICISGGEPLCDDKIFNFMKEIKNIGLKIKLDTNGTFPDRLIKAIKDGLVDYVAMDIKNSLEKYPETVGIKNFDISPIRSSIEFLLKNTVDYEFRTTLVKEFHTPDDIASIAKMIKTVPNYYLQNFIDSGNIIGNDLHGFSNEELIAFKKSAQKYVLHTHIR